ncbi:hypothetical protein BHE90_005198 [Fusarium euwallaceae]|uniref:Methyltransferase domain-containing protein n=2 Tax=Fusarium solani species complex TaxID=232080 RepID=A0A430LXA8_9HYPO|nr:hypothetical protein CDV31_012362 [Fusarium ambrosium]RTE80329.1 hypothetical protein BHE90_005198 [Fusarium euwallaceae]
MTLFHYGNSRQTKDSFKPPRRRGFSRLLSRSKSHSPAPNRTQIDIGKVNETKRSSSLPGTGEEPRGSTSSLVDRKDAMPKISREAVPKEILAISKGDTYDANTVDHFDFGGGSLALARLSFSFSFLLTTPLSIPMTVENDQALSHSEYWDERYSKSDGAAPTHEWFRSSDDLEQFFQKNLFEADGLKPSDNPLILHLGSGDSVIPVELASRGYKRQLCVDFSPTVVDLMTERHAEVEGIEWKLMDVRDMAGVSDKSIDVAFDKGTLDAMIHGSPWNPPQTVKENTSGYLEEVHRVLKDDGVFLYVTFRQPHFMKPLLNPVGAWDMDIQVLSDAGSFDYYGYMIRKEGTG